MTRRMKSDQVRTQWAEVLRRVDAGETIVVEHYNRARALITPMRCALLNEDPDWFAVNWEDYHRAHPLAIAPPEAFTSCDRSAVTEREGMPCCAEHAAEWDRKYGGPG